MTLRRGSSTLAVVTALAAMAAGVAGCGSSDEDQVRGVFADLQDAFVARDYDELCAVTTADAQNHIGQIGHEPPSGNCKLEMRRLVGMARANPVEPAMPQIVRLSVDGDRATAIIATKTGSQTRVPFAKEDGDWKVDALYGGVPASEQADKYRTTQ